MKNKGQTKIIIIVAMIIIVLTGGIYFYNHQKSITGQAIANLERELEEQGELTAEQEEQLEELAKVTCKDVQVPYDAQEEYTEQEPYSDEECKKIPLAYNQQAGSCNQYDDNFFADDEPASYSYTINNLDQENGGIFVVDIGFNIGGQIVKEEQSKYIYPASSHTFYTEKMAKIKNCYFDLKTVPTKTVCETLTKYKTVTKYRTITKYRTETVCE